MTRASRVILAPVVTERTAMMKDATRTLCFKVAKKANKIEIREAVQTLFKVKVAGVRTMHVHGKTVRRGRNQGMTPDWKKAYVTLAPGEKMIEYFEGT